MPGFYSVRDYDYTHPALDLDGDHGQRHAPPCSEHLRDEAPQVQNAAAL